MATIEKVGNNYKAKIRLKGSPLVCRSFRTKTEARLWAEAAERDIRAGRFFEKAEAEKHDLGDLIDRYLKMVSLTLSSGTLQAVRPRLAWWKGRIGYLLLSQITPAVIIEARDDLLKESPHGSRGKRGGTGAGISTTSVWHYLKTLKAVLKFARTQLQWISVNPMEGVPIPKPRPGRERFLDEAELSRLLAACKASRSPFLHPVVVLLAFTGCRLREVLRLRWDQVCLDPGRECIHLGALDTKTKQARSVPLVKEALEIVRKLFDERDSVSPYVFPSPEDLRQPVDTIKTSFRTAVRAAKIKDFNRHDLRHTFVSTLLRRGMSLAEIGKLVGHKAESMTARYGHLATGYVEERFRAAMAR